MNKTLANILCLIFIAIAGLYVEGNGTAMGGYEASPVGPPANYWEDWERPVQVEFFERDGRPGFSMRAGLKMFGKTSRKLPQKSLHQRKGQLMQIV